VREPTSTFPRRDSLLRYAREFCRSVFRAIRKFGHEAGHTEGYEAGRESGHEAGYEREGAGGQLSGGRSFSRGALYLLLQNHLYRGEVAHNECNPAGMALAHDISLAGFSCLRSGLRRT
jgi:hypothetical protein